MYSVSNAQKEIKLLTETVLTNCVKSEDYYGSRLCLSVNLELSREHLLRFKKGFH